MIQLNGTIIKELNKRIFIPTHPWVPNGTMFFNQSVVAFPIQQVKKVSAIGEMLQYKCRGKTFRKFNKEKKGYIENAIKMGNGAEFYTNINESYNILEEIFRLKPIILNDFHALFDRKGNMYFIDLDEDNNDPDRMKLYEKSRIQITKQCLEKIVKLRKEVKRMISTITK